MLRLALILRAHDEDTAVHNARVGRYADVVARACGLSEPYAGRIGLASALHDIGKLALPASILKKPTALDEQEWALVTRHPAIGAQLLRKADDPFWRLAADIALGHHERFDGNGYPGGLAGYAIPLSCRIVALVDVFDALTTRRVYRPPFSDEQVFALIRQERGRHFDPRVVDVFFSNLDQVLRVREHLDDAAASTDPAGGVAFG